MGDLSKNFSRSEFACPHCGEVEIDPLLVATLQRIRDKAGPVTGNPHAVTASQTGAVALLSGATASRPAAPATGTMYFDTTLGMPVWYDGSGWVDATGTTA